MTRLPFHLLLGALALLLAYAAALLEPTGRVAIAGVAEVR
jgi:hypothetical protein